MRAVLGFRMCVKARLESRLSLAERIVIRNHLFALKMSLIRELRLEKYEPRGSCPNCLRELTSIEIIEGFNEDPNDFTTKCPKCGERFTPLLICFGPASRIELPFYCKCQILALIADKAHLPPEQLSQKYPAVYRSAVVHFGGIVNAFKAAKLKYDFKEEVNGWKNKVMPFLGSLPDRTIAACAGPSSAAVRRLREKHGIPRFSGRLRVAEADD